MKRLDLKTGFACNNRCIFCVQGDKRLKYVPRKTNELIRLLEEGREHNQGLVLTGGEVTIRKDFLELIREANRLGYRPIQVQTNGRMFANLDFCKKTIQAGATEFSPALHGSSAAIHDSLTRAESFRQTCKGILNLDRLGQTILTNTVVVKQNLEDLPSLVRLLYRLGVRQMQLAMVHPLGTAWDNFEDVTPRLSEASPWLIAAAQTAEHLGVHLVTEAMPPCLLGNYRHLAVEAFIPATEIIDAEVRLDDYGRYRREEGKRKSAGCSACVLNAQCEGPWREYIDRYGDEDLKPLQEVS